MKYEVMVEAFDFIDVEAKSEEDAKQAAVDIARNGGVEWTTAITREWEEE